MKPSEQFNLSWEFRFPNPEETRMSDIRFSRDELCTLLQEGTTNSIDRIVNGYKLGSNVSDAMYNKVSKFDTILVARGEAEYIESTLPIGSAVAKLGKLALIDNDLVQQIAPKEKKIYLSINSVAEEAKLLLGSLSKVLAVYKDDKDMVYDVALKRMTKLSEDPKELMSTSVVLAYARRLVKYGLLRTEDMPVGIRDSFGFKDWMQHCKTTQGKTKPYSKSERGILNNYYVNEDMAIKNLRTTVWSDILASTVGVGIKHDPFLYAIYGHKMDYDGKYSVTFNNKGISSTVRTEEVKEALECIFTPNKCQLKAVGSKIKKTAKR